MSLVLKTSILAEGLFLFQNPEEGAQTQIYCSIANDLEKFNGEHFHDCHAVKKYKSARDPAAAKLLWEVSEKLVTLKK